MNLNMKDLPTQRSGRVRDQRIGRVVELVTPAEILDDLPLSPEQEEAVLARRAAVAGILDRRDDRLLVIVGPCSIHDPKAGLEYARRLVSQAEKHREDLLIVMRTYFEKPRTTVGWKGLINDPRLDGSHDMVTGLRTARHFLQQVTALGLDTRGVVLRDASGLSRENRVRADLLTRLLALGYDGQHPVLRRALDGLPIGGLTGTLDENGKVVVTLPKLAAGSYKLTVTHTATANTNAASSLLNLTVQQ